MKNREKIKYITVGIILATVLSSIGLAAVFNRKADLDFNKIKVVVNNKEISSNNILYEGTTYVPIRDVAESLGGTVDFHSETNTANIVVNSGSDNIKTIDKDSAASSKTDLIHMDFISVARMFKDKYPNAKIKDIEYKFNSVNSYYEVEGLDEEMEYEIKIGLDGNILNEKSEIVHSDARLEMKYEGFVISELDGIKSIDEIKAIATSKINGDIKDIKLSKEYGNLVYEVEVIKGNKDFDIDINARTGEILKVDD